jgi:predicted lipoprotein with Yx(FWY)xxD motif
MTLIPHPSLQRAGLAALMALTLAACANMGTTDAPAKLVDGVLVGPNQMTLYTFDRDTLGSGKSVCNSNCAANWPPLAAKADAKAQGDWSLVLRDDGTRQWAYKGRPLYFWAKDSKPGDRTGDGVNRIWHLATP